LPCWFSSGTEVAMFRATCVLLLLVAACSASIVNKNIAREIDLTSHVARYTHSISFENSGSAAVSTYKFGIPVGEVDSLSFIGAEDTKGDALIVKKGAVQSGVQLFDISVPSVSAGGYGSVKVECAFVKRMQPLPKQIAQGEAQRMVFESNHYSASAYRTESQTTKVKLASANVISRSEHSPSATKGSEIEYGPYSDIAPFSSSPMRIHFESNVPFFVMKTSRREVWIPASGHAQVEDHLDMKHTGAELKGFFSRIDYQRNPMQQGQSAIRSIRAELPRKAEEVYYRDTIGNISTSRMRQETNAVVVDVVPRYPLFGGWKTNFLFGYYLSLKEVASAASGNIQMKVPFGCPFEDAVLDQHSVKIVFPAGAANPNVEDVPDGAKVTRERVPAFASLAGRHAITITMNNVVDEHSGNLVVSYSLAPWWSWRDQWLMVVLVSLFFIVVNLIKGLFGGTDAIILAVRDSTSLRDRVCSAWIQAIQARSASSSDAKALKEKAVGLTKRLAQSMSEVESGAASRNIDKDFVKDVAKLIENDRVFNKVDKDLVEKADFDALEGKVKKVQEESRVIADRR